MQQITVSSVQLDEFGAGGIGPAGSTNKCFHDPGNLRDGQPVRNLIAFGERNGAGGKDRGPSALSRSDGLSAIPGLIGARFPAGMRQLNARHRTLFRDEMEYPAQGFDVKVAPDTKVLGADAPVRRDGRGFRNYGGGTAYRTTTKVDKV